MSKQRVLGALAVVVLALAVVAVALLPRGGEGRVGSQKPLPEVAAKQGLTSALEAGKGRTFVDDLRLAMSPSTVPSAAGAAEFKVRMPESLGNRKRSEVLLEDALVGRDGKRGDPIPKDKRTVAAIYGDAVLIERAESDVDLFFKQLKSQTGSEEWLREITVNGYRAAAVSMGASPTAESGGAVTVSRSASIIAWVQDGTLYNLSSDAVLQYDSLVPLAEEISRGDAQQ